MKVPDVIGYGYSLSYSGPYVHWPEGSWIFYFPDRIEVYAIFREGAD